MQSVRGSHGPDVGQHPPRPPARRRGARPRSARGMAHPGIVEMGQSRGRRAHPVVGPDGGRGKERTGATILSSLSGTRRSRNSTCQLRTKKRSSLGGFATQLPRPRYGPIRNHRVVSVHRCTSLLRGCRSLIEAARFNAPRPIGHLTVKKVEPKVETMRCWTHRPDG
jgi:hypothetical protein